MSLSGAVSVEVTFRADAAGTPNYWVNRWEIGQVANGTFSDAMAVADAFRVFHRTVLLDSFWVDSVRLSTYAPDGVPYNPDSLFVMPYNQRGLRGGALTETGALPLTNVFHLRKLCGSGRLGHLFLRGYLIEGDIASDPMTGGVSLQGRDEKQTSITAAYGALTAALPAGTSIAMISGSGLVLQQRDVTGLSVAGIASRAFRTKRKTRLVSNAVTSLRSIVGDGAISLLEAPQAISDITNILRALGSTLPPLLP